MSQSPQRVGVGVKKRKLGRQNLSVSMRALNVTDLNDGEPELTNAV